MKVGEFSHCRPLLQWIGYRRWILHQDPQRPFFYTTRAGNKIQPPDKMKTDLGSTPHLTHRILPPTEFAPPYLIHDEVCYRGEIAGVPTTRKHADQLLVRCILAQCRQMGYTLQWKGWAMFRARFLIYPGLRIFAFYKWIRGRPQFKPNSTAAKKSKNNS